MDGETTRGEHFLESLDRGLRVLASFDASHPRQTLTAVAERTDLGRATARRILLTLVDLGYVRLEGRDFSLAPRVLDFGFSYLAGTGIVGAAEPHIRDLSIAVNESVLLAVLDGHDVRYVARANAPRAVHLNVPVGERSPAHVTSAGRLLLANLPEDRLVDYLATVELHPYTPWTVTDRDELGAQLRDARSRGWAESSNELDVGMQGVSVLVPTSGTPTALSTVFPITRFDDGDLVESVIEPLRTCARAIARDAGGSAARD